MPFKSGDRILFQGDSITDCGCRDTSNQNPLGTGYVAIVRGLLSARHPDLDVTVLNRGVSGDRTAELLARWADDTKTPKPSWLSIKIGVNDVWRKLNNPAAHIPLPQFQSNYRQLLEQARAWGIHRLVLMSPTYIDDDPATELNRMIDDYGAVVQQLAKDFHAVYVPARERMAAAIKKVPAVRWTSDGCHPTIAGHAVLANAWLEAIGA
jgi:lysophospholipase L1-like esterase